ncbi:putative membrane-associated trancriptional regulator [Halapricum desulfuricans]|uniref:Putative membrane-associated trancriptional regulator n=1 Tax=Halapricum desulfuricans TaxID=2841257 RepID=A0A897NFC8_9EURY|nr:hypothetical protein [Halapricum desulfuricans]QSG11071.1 putative membrane-associated trancriptional regulator [Halapricum desulfuricans]
MPRPDRRTVATVVVAVLVMTLSGTPFRLLGAAGEFVGAQWHGVRLEAPEWLLLGAALAVFALVSLLLLAGLVRLLTSVGVVGSRVASAVKRLRPDSSSTAALAFMIAAVAVLFVGLAVVLPWFGAALTEDTGMAGIVEDIRQGDVETGIEDRFVGDTVERGNGTESPRGQSLADTDGDGLADEWERAGRTPDGAPLQDADPERLDLYVQLEYGDGVSRLSDAEREQLRSVWASMPIENPDGSSGISLHIVDSGDHGGDLDRSVSITDDTDIGQFYTRERLGDRSCTYRQVTLGTAGEEGPIGYAETPGYASVVDGTRFADYEGNVSLRVATITHVLLHNVVGEIEGRAHSDGGWLDYPAPEHERLTDPVAERLKTDGFVVLSADAKRCGEKP